MANFVGSHLPFDWYLGGSSFQESGLNLSKSYSNVVHDSSSRIEIKGVQNMWGKGYNIEATYYGSFGTNNSSVTDVVIDFGAGSLVVSEIKGIDLNDLSDNNLDRFNSKYLKYDDTIFASKNDDRIDARSGNDYLWGDKGADTLIGGIGDDLIVGGKGIDYLEGGKGADHFGVSKKLGKGKKNWDLIADFEVGEDAIYIDGSSKKMWIDNYEGDAILVRGKSDVIAWVEGAGGQLDWSSDGTWIM
jgi:Ca2+-binding RTX toxin-like protein